MHNPKIGGCGSKKRLYIQDTLCFQISAPFLNALTADFRMIFPVRESLGEKEGGGKQYFPNGTAILNLS